MTDAYCSSLKPIQVTLCPDNMIDAPVPSTYWLTDETRHNYASQHIGDFVQNSSDSTDMHHKIIHTEQYVFAPDSHVRAEVHSEVAIIGEGIVDVSGSASFSVVMPPDLHDGFHTIHLFGISYSGQPIDLYQVIKYAKDDEDSDVAYNYISVDPPEAQSDSSAVSRTIATDQVPTQVISDKSLNRNETSSRALNKNSVDDQQTSTHTALQEQGFNVFIFLIPALIWIVLGIGFEVKSRFFK